ncbi:MAG: 6-carboxytetrahydropterin synthase [Alphaproteobacteria bacterium]|nr:MAG: 6-carboxytetrahydropterin synthase [Alphaproteobacteria bacterium]
MSYAIQFERRISMAHRLIAGASEKCATPHGHNEYIRVWLQPENLPLLAPYNMVASFEDLKRAWHRWLDDVVDHALQLNHTDPLLSYFQQHEPQRLSRIMVTPYDPTTEMTCALYACKLQALIAAESLPVTLHALEVEETPTNKVRLDALAQDATILMLQRQQGWWNRPDLSMNDL